MLGKIHKKKMSEYTEAAVNEDERSDRGEGNDNEMLNHVDVPRGSDSENGDQSDNQNKSLDSANANDDAGNNSVIRIGLDDDTDFQLSGDEVPEEGESKKAKKRKATRSKKTACDESDDEPLNCGSQKKRGRKPPAKGKAKAKKSSYNDDDDECEEEYEVKDIVGHKTKRGVSYFCIRWKGYTKAHDTWEPENTLSCPEIVERYKKKCLTNSTTERYTTEQRVKIVEAFYKNGFSNQKAFRALRAFFGQRNRPNVSTIGRIVRKFQQTGSVGNVKTPVLHARPVCSAETIAIVRDSVAEEPSISTRRRAQQLNISRTSLMRILKKI